MRAERQAAGIAKAKDEIRNGTRKPWGGSKKGERKKVTADKIEIIKHMKEQGKPITAIAAAVGVSRPTVYGVLNEV